MWELVTQGTPGDLAQLGSYESKIEEGQRGKLLLYLSNPVSAGAVQALDTALKSQGVADMSITTSGSILTVLFRKAFPWLAVIAAAILGIIILSILIVSWQLYKESPAAFAFTTALIIGGIALLILLILLIFRGRLLLGSS